MPASAAATSIRSPMMRLPGRQHDYIHQGDSLQANALGNGQARVQPDQHGDTSRQGQAGNDRT